MEHTGARPKEIKVPQRRASAVKTASKGNRQPGKIGRQSQERASFPSTLRKGSERAGSGNQQFASGAEPSLITEALRNSTESSEIAPDVHSTTQMPGKLSLVKKQSLYTLLHQNAHTIK